MRTPPVLVSNGAPIYPFGTFSFALATRISLTSFRLRLYTRTTGTSTSESRHRKTRTPVSDSAHIRAPQLRAPRHQNRIINLNPLVRPLLPDLLAWPIFCMSRTPLPRRLTPATFHHSCRKIPSPSTTFSDSP
jgi:hypothetical protein